MAVSKKQQEEFINMMIPIAQRQAKAHGNKIYPSVCIGQACQESGYGTSKKMKKANAVFGIKVGKAAYHFGKAWNGASYNTITSEYYDGKTETKITDNFRAYSSIEDATEDYFDMLCHCKRYKPALNESSPKRCIEAIVRGGYATGPEYAKHTMSIINTHNLTRFDKMEYFKRYIGETVSIVIALENIGVDASYPYRKKIYIANFGDGYKGTDKQNTAMLDKLKRGILIKPD
jgi:flagellum-specific peptidoglycan hydrolase FlgJ